MMKKRILLFTAIGLAAAGLIVYPAEAAQAAVEALRRCGTAVIPALLPFFVLTKLLAAQLRPHRASPLLDRIAFACFGVDGSCILPFFISLIGGYPVGVSTTVSMYTHSRLSKTQAERLLRFCNNSGPAFFVGLIGSVVLSDVRMGLFLYGVHCLCAVLTGILFAESSVPRYAVYRRDEAPTRGVAAAFQDAVQGSCAALLQICGLVTLCSVLVALCRAVGLFRLFSYIPFIPQAEIQALFCGTIELTNGILSLSGTEHQVILCAFLMGWGSLCVHLQAASLWQPLGLHPRHYFTAKLTHGLLSALLTAALTQGSFPAAAVMVAVALICLLSALRRARRCRASASVGRRRKTA